MLFVDRSSHARAHRRSPCHARASCDPIAAAQTLEHQRDNQIVTSKTSKVVHLQLDTCRDSLVQARQEAALERHSYQSAHGRLASCTEVSQELVSEHDECAAEVRGAVQNFDSSRQRFLTHSPRIAPHSTTPAGCENTAGGLPDA